MALGTLVGRGFVRIDADTSPAQKAIKGLTAIGSLAALGAAGAAIGPVMGLATTAVLSLSSAFAVAGGAATAFGAAVVPQFKAITEASQQQATAEDQKTKATVASREAQRLAKEGGFEYGKQVEITKDMTDSARAKAEEYNHALTASESATRAAGKSQAIYKEKLAAMPPATRETALALEDLKDDTKAWSDALAANTMPIFTKGIEFLRGLLPKLTPLVREVSAEITDFSSTLGEGQAGRVFREFGANVLKNGAGALRTLLNTVRNVIVGVVGVLNAFQPASKGVTKGLEEMTAKFATFGANLGKSEGFQKFMADMRAAGPSLGTTFRQIAETVITVVQAMGPLAGTSLKVAQAFATLISAIPTPILKLLAQAIVLTNVALKLYAIYQGAAAAATWLFATSVTTSTGAVYSSRIALIAHRIVVIASTVASYALLAAIYALSAALWLTTTPIGLVVLAIVALAAGFVIAWKKSETFRNIVKAALSGVVTAGKAVGEFFSGPFVRFFTKTIPNAFQSVLDWVRSNWPWIIGGLGGPVGLAIVWIIKNWDKITEALSKTLSSVVDFFRKLPGRIIGGLGDLGRLLVNAGRSLITGLLRGAVTVTNTIGQWERQHIFNPITNFFRNAPSWLLSAGKRIITGLINGQLAIARTLGSWFTSRVRNPVVNFFRNSISWLTSAGRRVITGLINGQLAIARTLGSWFTSRVRNPVVNFFRNSISWLNSAGRRTISGLLNGLRAIASGLSSWFTRNVKNPIVNRFAQAGTWLFSAGKRVISGMASGFWETLKSVGSWAKRIKDAIVGAIKSLFGIKSPSTVMAALGGHMMRGLLNGLLKGKDFLKAAVKGLFKNPVAAAKNLIKNGINVVGFLGKNAAKYAEELFGSLGLGTSKGVDRFKTTVALALRLLGQPIGLMGITLRRMQQESGGNPNIVNKWDSNWKAGTPSVGLMQVIGPTFRAYAGKYAKTGPFLYGVSVNPLANIYASMRYALARYGSLSAAYGRAGGYDRGGLAMRAGWIPKYTNQPERILSPRQTALFERMITGGGVARTAAPAGSTVVIEKLVLENHGVIGSRQEVENWLVTTLDQLRRKGRIK